MLRTAALVSDVTSGLLVHMISDSVFGTYCLMCNFTNGILKSVCQYTNCSEERPSLCVKGK